MTNAATKKGKAKKEYDPKDRHYDGGDGGPRFSPKQLHAFLHAAEAYGKRELTMFVLSYLYALRNSELASLRLSNIAFDEKEIRIQGIKKGKRAHYPFLSINGYSVETLLREYLEQRAKYDHAKDNDFVFITQKPGDHISRQQIYRLFAEICENAGIGRKFRHPHVLRHTRGRNLHLAGWTPQDIAKWLRHRDFRSVYVYTVADMEDLGARAAKTDESYSDVAAEKLVQFDSKMFVVKR